MKKFNDRRRARRRTQSTIDAFVTVAILVAVGVIIWRNWPPPPPPPIPIPAEPIALDGAATKGSQAARVALVEYSDFECPYCGGFARDTLPKIDQRYLASGKVLFVFRHITPPTHKRAGPTAAAAICAGRQGKFWQMHDRLFGDQTKLDDESLAVHADSLGLDVPAFSSCLGSRETADIVARDNADARRLRIAGTPSFFIGIVQPDGRIKATRSLRGAVPMVELQKALEAELGSGSLGGLFSQPLLIGFAALSALAVALILSAFWVRRRRARRGQAINLEPAEVRGPAQATQEHPQQVRRPS